MYKVPLKNIAVPEFDRHRKVLEGEAYVFDAPCRYQVILGNDFLSKAGLDIKYSSKTIEWFGNSIPMRNPRSFSPDDAQMCVLMLSMDVDDDFMSDHFNEDIWDNYATQILDAL